MMSNDGSKHADHLTADKGHDTGNPSDPLQALHANDHGHNDVPYSLLRYASSQQRHSQMKLKLQHLVSEEEANDMADEGSDSNNHAGGQDNNVGAPDAHDTDSSDEDMSGQNEERRYGDTDTSDDDEDDDSP